jgi:hypothetical protein
MTAVLISTTEQVSAASAVVVAYGRTSTASASIAVETHDPLIEAPIEFVPGVEAHPSREPQPEPSGSGPFGF